MTIGFLSPIASFVIAGFLIRKFSIPLLLALIATSSVTVLLCIHTTGPEGPVYRMTVAIIAFISLIFEVGELINFKDQIKNRVFYLIALIAIILTLIVYDVA